MPKNTEIGVKEVFFKGMHVPTQGQVFHVGEELSLVRVVTGRVFVTRARALLAHFVQNQKQLFICQEIMFYLLSFS